MGEQGCPVLLLEGHCPGDVCVAFFNVPSGNKDAPMPNPLMEEEIHRLFNRDNECFKIHPRVLHNGLLLWRHFHAPKHEAAQNETWLVASPVSHMPSWAVLGHSKQLRFPDLLPSVRRSGYARLSFTRHNNNNRNFQESVLKQDGARLWTVTL